MRKANLITPLTAFSIAVLFASTATAQVGPGGATGGNGDAGSTTEGFGGSTTDGFGAGAAESTEGTFIGGPNLENFIGGTITTDRNGNRQFRSITNPNLITGGNRQTGTPRIKRTRLRIAFDAPQPAFLPQLRQRQFANLQQISVFRPGLNGVRFQVDNGGTATLTGAAPDAATRRLAANLLRMEPGVRRIRNDVAIEAKQ